MSLPDAHQVEQVTRAACAMLILQHIADCLLSEELRIDCCCRHPLAVTTAALKETNHAGCQCLSPLSSPV